MSESIISNTGPLIALTMIDHLDLLKQLYNVLLPRSF